MEPVPPGNRILPVTCRPSLRHAACVYSWIRPLRTGFGGSAVRRWRSRSTSSSASFARSPRNTQDSQAEYPACQQAGDLERHPAQPAITALGPLAIGQVSHSVEYSSGTGVPEADSPSPGGRQGVRCSGLSARTGLRRVLVSYFLAASLRCQASSVAGVTGKTSIQRLRGMSHASVASHTRSVGSYRARLTWRRSTTFSCRSTSSSASFAPSPRNTGTARPGTRHVSM
jgi:hypothetical protein